MYCLTIHEGLLVNHCIVLHAECMNLLKCWMNLFIGFSKSTHVLVGNILMRVKETLHFGMFCIQSVI